MIMAAPLPRTLLQYEHIFFPLTDLFRCWAPDWKAEVGDWARGTEEGAEGKVWEEVADLPELAEGGATLEEGVRM